MKLHSSILAVIGLSLVGCGKLGDDSCFGKHISCDSFDVTQTQVKNEGLESLRLTTFPDLKWASQGYLAEQGPLRFGPDGKVWTLEDSQVKVFDLEGKKLASGSAPSVPNDGTRWWSLTVAESWAELTTYAPHESSDNNYPPIESTRFTLQGKSIATGAPRHFELVGERILNQRIENDGSRLIAMDFDEQYAVLARFDSTGHMLFRQNVLRNDRTGYDNRGQVLDPTVDFAAGNPGTWVLDMPNRAAARLSLLNSQGTITEQTTLNDAEDMAQSRLVSFGPNDLAIITEREDAVTVRRITSFKGTSWTAVTTDFKRASEAHPTVHQVHAGKDGSVYLEIDAESGVALCRVSREGHPDCDNEPLLPQLGEIYVDASSRIHAALDGELITLTR